MQSQNVESVRTARDQTASKRPYETPTLTIHGSVEEMTQATTLGASQLTNVNQL